MEFTVAGARGFIGSHLIRWFQSQGISYWAPERGEDILGRPLGHFIYSIGTTADFRERPFDTVRAHVCSLLDVLEKAHFHSFLYLSSTRVYSGLDQSHEDAVLRINPSKSDDLYNITKLCGESVCLGSGRPNVRIARLSNVYGADFSSRNFLMSILRDDVDHRRIVLRTSLDSEKDYVDVNDVARLLPQIARAGSHRIYNVASGVNTRHSELIDVLQRTTGCTVEVNEGAPLARFPAICLQRVRSEFAFSPAPVTSALPGLVQEYERQRKAAAI